MNVAQGTSIRFFVGAETHLFMIDELVKGLAGWPNRFRLKLSASPRSGAKTFYGASCYEVAEKAAEFMAGRTNQSSKDRAINLSQGPPASPRQTLHLQQQESD